ncbi:MAG: hypothetical protein ABI261_03995 [Ginsengibacter sp.]
MKKYLLAGILLIALSCKKESASSGGQTKPPAVVLKCGTILSTPILDSFVYPTYYLTANVAFKDGNEIIHFHDNVTGDHDGSWFISKYNTDSTICITP